MRRALMTSLRAARRSLTLKPYATTSALRRYSTSRSPYSMRELPRAGVAVVGALAAASAWWAYKNPDLPTKQTERVRSISSQAPIAQVTPAAITAHDRKALVVDDDQFFTGQIIGDGPLAKDTDDYGRKVLEMLSPEQATERIRSREQSYLVGRGRGIVRYDLDQLPSNDPIEDDHAQKIIEYRVDKTDGTTSDWSFFAVMDGHSGWTTSAKLRNALIPYVARELNTTYKATPSPEPSTIDAAIKSAFLKLDREICQDSVEALFKKPSKNLAAELLAPALSGSCALLSFYDSRTKTLRVACTGDSRAVLGRKNPKTGKWTATPLSEDQTGSNPKEEARIKSEHPGEPQAVYRGRVLGSLEPTRAFGDASYKWSRDIQDKLKASFFGRSLNPALRSPPYVTAEPVVTTTKIQPENGDFVIMATDGLWEMISNEECIGLVGAWIEAQNNASSPAKASPTAWLGSWFGGAKEKGLPVEKGGNSGRGGLQQGDPEPPIRQQQWNIPNAKGHERFVTEDKNCASHLIRNALGGNDRDMVSALLTLPSPFSRRYRDDLTVNVIFFGEADSNGVVRVNEEASAKMAEPKAKL